MKQDFSSYVKNHIKEYLPSSYENAVITETPVRRSNGRELNGIAIRNDLNKLMPSIFLNEYEEMYRNGMDLDKVMVKIANNIVADERLKMPSIDDKVLNSVFDYETIKPMLALKLCDLKDSKEFLKDKPYTPFGNLAITYRIQFFTDGSSIASSVVDNTILEIWNISKEQLHEDALQAENKRSEIRLFGKASGSLDFDQNKNLYHSRRPLRKPLYMLTNEQKTNGACAIVQNGVLEKLAKLFRDSYYIIPSSVHEMMLIPESSIQDGSLGKMDSMVADVNRRAVSIDEKLSDHAMFYDRKRKKLRYSRY